MSLYGMLKPKGPTGFGYSSTAADVTEGLDLSGKTIAITGCNSGLGLETMRVLWERGARVLGLARTVEKAQKAAASVDAEVTPVACELSEPESVQRAVATIESHDLQLDAIICNAGIMALPELNQSHGYELQFFTNHIGHFILVTGLLDSLSPTGRVVMLSSEGHKLAPKAGIEFDNLSAESGYNDWRAYGQSKLANLLFARELARRFEGTERSANAVHPGVIETNLGRHMNPLTNLGYWIGNPLVFKSVPEGAATQTYVAVHPDAEGISGEYWVDCNAAKSSKKGRDAELAKQLWDVSESIVEDVCS